MIAGTKIEDSLKEKHLNSNEYTQIIEELRLVSTTVNSLIELFKINKQREKLLGEWIHEKEVIKLTGLSRNTLYNFYKEGKVRRSSISGKSNYYKMSDFKTLLDKNEFN